MPATSVSWQHLPPPAEQVDLGFEATFTQAEAELLRVGLVPQEMEDKWFIYFDDNWLRFHRSWTGALIYALQLAESTKGVHVTASWVNRDPEQYTETDLGYDRNVLRFLIDALLLQKTDIAFPMRAGNADAPPGLFQHSYVGRANRESKADDDMTA
jgi:hypothetical protein